MEPTAVRRTITIDEWAKLFGVSRKSAYEAAGRDEIQGLIRIGRRLVVSKAAVDAQLAPPVANNSQRQPAAAG
jgi:hypothetical protein